MHTYIDTTINILLSMYRYAYYLSQYRLYKLNIMY